MLKTSTAADRSEFICNNKQKKTITTTTTTNRYRHRI
jgi:hypothetical protein